MTRRKRDLIFRTMLFIVFASGCIASHILEQESHAVEDLIYEAVGCGL